MSKISLKNILKKTFKTKSKPKVKKTKSTGKSKKIKNKSKSIIEKKNS